MSTALALKPEIPKIELRFPEHLQWQADAAAEIRRLKLEAAAWKRRATVNAVLVLLLSFCLLISMMIFHH